MQPDRGRLPDDIATQTVQSDRNGTLLRINNAIVNCLTEDELLTAIGEALRPVIAFDNLGMTFYDAATNRYRFVAMAVDDRASAFSVGREVDASQGAPEWDSTSPLLLADLSAQPSDAPFAQRLSAEGVRSFVAVPLLRHGRTLGTLGLASRTPGQYGEGDVIFLQQVAGQAALAAANLKSFAEITRISEEASRLAERRGALLEVNGALVAHLTQHDMFERVCRVLKRMMPCDNAGLAIYDPATDDVRIMALEGEFSGSDVTVGAFVDRRGRKSGHEWKLDRPVLRSDLEVAREYTFEHMLYASGLRSHCTVPLIVESEPLGTIGVGSRRPHEYSEAEITLLEEIANQVALAVANLNAYQEIARLKAKLQAENVYLREEIRSEHNFDEIIGTSAALRQTLAAVERVADTDSTVLVLGETGTGKELIARAIHERSRRRKNPLIKVNCGAITASLVESELFGHVKGAFTGALTDREGRFKVAHGGTLFLDEVGELSLETQVKLLRVLQEQEFEPIGSNRTIRVDVRIVAATNRDLEAAIRAGQFRADLFYRLNVFPVSLPPLRERKDDLPLLVAFFLERLSRRFGKAISVVSDAAMSQIVAYDWPGNLRELQNVLERAVILSRGTVLELEPLVPGSVAPPRYGAQDRPSAAATTPVAQGLNEVQKHHIESVLEKTNWVVEGPRGAAHILNLHPNTLRSRIKKLGIRRPATT